MGSWPSGGNDSNHLSKNSHQTSSSPHQDQDPDRARYDSEDEHNPFVAFRRFADDQLRILAQGLLAVPTLLSHLEERGNSSSTTTSPDDSRWSHTSSTTRASEPTAFMSSHFQSPLSSFASAFPPPNDAAFSNLEAVNAARALLLASRSAMARSSITPDAILRLYRDKPDLFSNEPRWLSVSWFQRSRYSPLGLETHRHAHQHGSMWRAAYEDLMASSLGTDDEGEAWEAWTGRRDDQERYGAWAQGGRDWMLGLQCRGVLPPMLPSLYDLKRGWADKAFAGVVRGEMEGPAQWISRDFGDLVREVSTFDADEREEQLRSQSQTAPRVKSVAPEQEQPTSEMDLYEQFLGKASSTSALEENSRPRDTTSKDVNLETAQKNKILSTLSTTERTTLPDGTVTTKMVLKKRFADGREESTETVTTTHARQQTNTEKLPVVSDHEAKQQSGEKKGWFWN